MNDIRNVCDFNARFRGFLPVVIDVETAGIVPATDALLEVAAVLLTMDTTGHIAPQQTLSYHIEPFPGANLDPKSLEFIKLDPYHPFRFALPEAQALEQLFKPIRQAIYDNRCQRAVLVGHNAWFDLLFIKAACERNKIASPFHAFTCFDTATMAAMCYGQTVLAKALKAANISFDSNEAHSAIYDAEKTAELFCRMVNEW